MGQAVKYAALGVAIVIILGLVGTLILGVTGVDITGGFAGSINRFLNTCSSVLQNVKGALNYACGEGGAVALNLLLWINLLLPIAAIPIRLVIMLHRFINQ